MAAPFWSTLHWLRAPHSRRKVPHPRQNRMYSSRERIFLGKTVPLVESAGPSPWMVAPKHSASGPVRNHREDIVIQLSNSPRTKIQTTLLPSPFLHKLIIIRYTLKDKVMSHHKEGVKRVPLSHLKSRWFVAVVCPWNPFAVPKAKKRCLNIYSMVR